MDPAKEARDILDFCHAVRTDGHFVYTSGTHGSAYIDKTSITPNVKRFHRLCELIALNLIDSLPDVVIGAAAVGAYMTHPVAQIIGEITHKYPIAIWADKTSDGKDHEIGRGFDKYLKHGMRVAIVEDIVNSGKTIRRLCQLVEQCDAHVISVHAICNRGLIRQGDLIKNITFNSLLTVNMESFEAADCPLCRHNIPINTDLGHGKKFIATRMAQQKELNQRIEHAQNSPNNRA